MTLIPGQGSDRRSLVLSLTGVLMLCGASVGSADYKSLYILGLQAVDHQRWREALVLFDRAAEENPDAGGLVRPYGTWFEPYVPYYYKGLAFYRLGEYADALTAWQEAERQGPICYPRSRRKYRTLNRLRRELPQILRRELERLQSRIASLQQELASLPTSVPSIRRGALQTDTSDPEAELRELERQLAEHDRQTAVRSREIVDSQSADWMKELAVFVQEARQTEARISRQVKDAQSRAIRARRFAELEGRYQDSERLTAAGDCQESARRLLELVHETTVDPVAQAGRLTPYLGLTRARLECGQLEQAAVYLELARRRRREPRGWGFDERTGSIDGDSEIDLEIRRVESLIASARHQQSALRDYDEAVSLLLAGGCQPVARRRLEGVVRRWRKARGPGERDPWTPHSLLAQAYLACGQLQATEASLHYASLSGESLPLREELAARLEQARAEGAGQGAPIVAAQDTGPRGEHANAGESEVAQAIHDYLTALAEIEAGVGECWSVRHRIEHAHQVLGTEPSARLASVEAVFGDEPYMPWLAAALAQQNCGDLDGTGKYLELARQRQLELASAPRSPAPTERLGAMEAWLKRAADNPYDGSYALLVVGHDYRHLDGQGWQDLPGAKGDIDVIRRALVAQGFQVEEPLENPTSEQLARGIRNFLHERGAPGARVIVYYAGHGWTERVQTVRMVKGKSDDRRLGYIVPVDSPHPDKDLEEANRRMLSMDRFNEYARNLRAHHALFVFDTCFGGTVFEAARVQELGESADLPVDPLNEAVRGFLTAGDETETVPDRSVFRQALTEGLRGEADVNPVDGSVWGHELGAYVQEQVRERSDTTPQFGKAAGLGRGEILFRNLSARADSTVEASLAGEARPAVSAVTRLRVEIDYWQAVWDLNVAAAYRSYLEVYPTGRFVRLAKRQLQRPR